MAQRAANALTGDPVGGDFHDFRRRRDDFALAHDRVQFA
jgi:hypothetical protein